MAQVQEESDTPLPHMDPEQAEPDPMLPHQLVSRVPVPDAPTMKKRCPKGERRNRKTGVCEPKTAAAGVLPIRIPPTEMVAEPREDPELYPDMAHERDRGDGEDVQVPGDVPITSKLTRDEEPPASADEEADEEADDEEADDQDPQRRIDTHDMFTVLEDDGAYVDDTNLYPTLDDPNFNVKLSEKREFFDTRFSGTVSNVEVEADKLCNAKIELAPYQAFVRNFLSNQTPYNGLLLYHGLGTGKTCSAITISEEYRDYMKQMGINKRIIIVGGKTIQDNYKHQLFDSDDLVSTDGLWHMKSGCIGNKMVKELNPMNTRDISKERIVKQVNRLISSAYWFVGYREFGNMIYRRMRKFDGESNKSLRNRQIKRAMEREFGERLIVIDEVHNVRLTDESSDDAKVAQRLIELTMHASVKLLLLSATPMFNTHSEIIWLLNLLSTNDKRPTVKMRDIFDRSGQFIRDDEGLEIGKQMLMRKATGYVSFVKGENPYTFPYRIYPSSFAPEHTLQALGAYPTHQLNGLEIETSLQHVNVYVLSLPPASYQTAVYGRCMESIVDRYSKLTSEQLEKGVGYQVLNVPIQVLNMTYPSSEAEPPLKTLYGKAGLKNTMNFDETDTGKSNFSYKHDVLETYGEIFASDAIGNYSLKIASIMQSIMRSTGIVLIYSQYIDGGVIPIALALESLGFTRYDADGNKSLFRNPPVPPIDALTLTPSEEGQPFRPAHYALITGDKGLSRDNAQEVRALTRENNKNGENIKVVVISRAASEGMDLKNVRQIHIVDPWYNMNRNEQIIGRGIRFRSHCDLPFSERNAEIYMYATYNGPDRETADLYLYRLSETKAISIGLVSRVLKQCATDCILNKEQALFSVESMNQTVSQTLSTGQTIEYPVGDKPFTAQCDYMASCAYECVPNKDITLADTTMDTYNESFIDLNTERIVQKVKDLFQMRFAYTKDELFDAINLVRRYPDVQINAALTHLVDDHSELLIDRFGKVGFLVNVEEYYLFQPQELTDEHVPMHDRKVPIQFKPESVKIELPDSIREPVGASDDEGDATPATMDPARTVAGLVADMEKEYRLAQEPHVVNKLTKNWYKVVGLVIERLAKNEGRTSDYFHGFVVDHQVESLQFRECLLLLNYLQRKLADGLTKYERLLWNNFEDGIYREDPSRPFKAILLWDDTQTVVVVQDSDGVWGKGKWSDQRDMTGIIKEKAVAKNRLATVVGAIVPFTSRNTERVFKYVDNARHGGKGARCDQKGRSKCLEILGLFAPLEKAGIEEVIDDYKEKSRTRSKDKTVSRDRTPSSKSYINPIFICVDIELYLRYYNKTGKPVGDKENMRWFLHPVEAIESKVPK